MGSSRNNNMGSVAAPQGSHALRGSGHPIKLTPASSPFMLLPFVPGGNGKAPTIRQPANIPPAILRRIPLSEIISVVATINDNVKRGFSHLDKKKYRLRSRGAALAIIGEVIFCVAIALAAYFIGRTLAMQWVAWVFGGVIILGSFWPGIKTARRQAANRRVENGIVKDDWLYPLIDQSCERLNQRYHGCGIVFFFPKDDPVFSCNAPGRRHVGVDSPFFRAFIVLQCDDTRLSACPSAPGPEALAPGLVAPSAPPMEALMMAPMPPVSPPAAVPRDEAGRVSRQRKSRPPGRAAAPAADRRASQPLEPQQQQQPMASPFRRAPYNATLTAINTIVDYGIPPQSLAPAQPAPFVAEGVHPAPFPFMQPETPNPQLQSAVMLF